MQIQPIDFNEGLQNVRENDKNLHEVFNNVLESNLEGIKEFLKDKYEVALIKDEEHSLNQLHFRNKGHNDFYGLNFEFEDVCSICTFDDISSISNILKDYVIGLKRGDLNE